MENVPLRQTKANGQIEVGAYQQDYHWPSPEEIVNRVERAVDYIKHRLVCLMVNDA